jgi:nucleotide-binding universal stress UspA family protein
MPKKILVPLDGSVSSEAVLPHVAALAECTGAKIVLLRVLPTKVGETLLVNSVPSGIPPTSHRDERVEAERYLGRIAYEYLTNTLDTRLEVCGGPTAETILDYASGNGADLIAMTTHGRGGMAHLVMGSVAERVVRESHLPVLLVRAH